MEFNAAQLDQWKKEYWGQRRQLVLAIVLGVFSIGLMVLGGQQLSGLIGRTNASLRKERDTLAKIQRRVKLIEEITSDDRAAFDQAAKALPASKQPIAILRSLEEISEQTGMSVGHYDLNPGLIATEEALLAEKKKQDEGIESFIIKLELTGSFTSLLDALQEIEQTLPLMEVMNLTISPVSQQLNENISLVPYKAELQVRSFFAILNANQIVEAARNSGTIQFTTENEQTMELIAPLRYRLTQTNILQGDLPNFSNTDVFGIDVPLEQRELSASPSSTVSPEGTESSASEGSPETSEGSASTPTPAPEGQ